MKVEFLENYEGRFNANHRKENKFYTQYSAIAFDSENAKEVAVLRIYRTDSRVYACFWAYGKENIYKGSGLAGGYGYHMASAAADEAIENAGIKLSESINGVGDGAIRETIKAIASALYPENKVFIVEAHG